MTTQTNGGWIEKIPAVEIELLESGNLRVTDKSDFNEDHSVDLHPIHLRLMAEKLGMVRQATASEAAVREKLESEIASLERERHRLQFAVLSIRDRTEHLFKDLCLELDAGHKDMALPVAKCAALTDIIQLAVEDFKDDWEFGERVTHGKQDKPEDQQEPRARAPSKSAARALKGGTDSLFEGDQ